MQEEKFEKQLKQLLSLVTLSLPKFYTVPLLAENIGVERRTLAAHLRNNFKENVDFFQEKAGGKITIPVVTALQCQAYYEAKNA